MKKRRLLLLALTAILVFAFATTALAVQTWEQSTWYSFGIVKQGDTGGRVRAIQNITKYYLGKGSSYVVDGQFGSATKNYVKEYQQNKNLTVDGIVGHNTWESMFKGLKFKDISGVFDRYVTEYCGNGVYTTTPYFRNYISFDSNEWDTYKAAAGSAPGQWYRMD